jgi:hypothetical protein
MEKMIDWESLSWVEYSSGIDVLYLAKYFRQNKKTHASIMKHALDEYRHGTHYRNLAKKYTGINKINTNDIYRKISINHHSDYFNANLINKQDKILYSD